MSDQPVIILALPVADYQRIRWLMVAIGLFSTFVTATGLFLLTKNGMDTQTSVSAIF